MNKIRVKVTKEHINSGVIQESRACPVALALRTANLEGVRVEGYEIKFLWRGKRRVVPQTKKIRDFVGRFDHGQPVKPFTFTLRIP